MCQAALQVLGYLMAQLAEIPALDYTLLKGIAVGDRHQTVP